MKRQRIILLIGLAVVSIATISISVVLAQENGKSDSNASRLATKVAAILGLDAAEVNDAINEARGELRNEAVESKLNDLIEKGRLTEEEAGEYLNWIQSRPQGIPGMGKQFLGKMGPHRDWKYHGHFFESRHYFKEEPSLEALQNKLNAMVEDGEITEAEATEKLKGIQLNKP